MTEHMTRRGVLAAALTGVMAPAALLLASAEAEASNITDLKESYVGARLSDVDTENPGVILFLEVNGTDGNHFFADLQVGALKGILDVEHFNVEGKITGKGKVTLKSPKEDTTRYEMEARLSVAGFGMTGEYTRKESKRVTDKGTFYLVIAQKML